VPADGRADLLGIQAVLVERDGDHARAREREDLQRREVARALHHDDVARIQDRGGHEVERLLGARGDEHLLVPDRVEPAGAAQAGEGRAQVRLALGDRVLQVAAGLRAVEHAVVGRRQPGHVEQLGRGQAARQREDVRLLGELEDLADRGALDAGHAAGERRRGHAVRAFSIAYDRTGRPRESPVRTARRRRVVGPSGARSQRP
jgi:hypothetical protein